MLEDEEGWDRARIEEVLASKKTRRIFPSDPLPVLLLYWTADPVDDETMLFYRDIYGRDAAVLEALEEPFVFQLPSGAPEYLRED